MILLQAALFLLTVIQAVDKPCTDPCFKDYLNLKCSDKRISKSSQPTILHMTVHPHLDAFWIYDLEEYYDPPVGRKDIWQYFKSNRFSPVRDIFTAATEALTKSKQFREQFGEVHEQARRSFANSEVCFFKRWLDEQNNDIHEQVGELLKTKYWQILGGGFVENDEAGAYYDDIIENYQLGSHFLEKRFGYVPKIAISADSFGHSQSMAALLVHFGIEAFIVQRMDEHNLKNGILEYIWKAKSANGDSYGTIPTHIRWAIHGYEEQFINRTPEIEPVCETKAWDIDRMRKENNFLKKLYKQQHVMRYFSHDFQRFDDYSYRVIEQIMRQFSKEKCNLVVGTYTNPTEYFKIVYKEVEKGRKMSVKEEDIFPIWDYSSGLYWTGYFTTDPFHKKVYRDSGRFLQLVRKIFLPLYFEDPKSQYNVEAYQKIQRFEMLVAYVQHHDGITCTSKYKVLDEYEDNVRSLRKQLTGTVANKALSSHFGTTNTTLVFNCSLEEDCVVPQPSPLRFVLQIFNSGGIRYGHFKIHLPLGVYYSSATADIETVCFCYEPPCNCVMYIFNSLGTYSSFVFNKQEKSPGLPFTLMDLHDNDDILRYNSSHITLEVEQKEYHLSYKRVQAEATPRAFEATNTYGNQYSRRVSIKSGKYALGNNPNKTTQFSTISSVSFVVTDRLLIYVVQWKRASMLTVLTTSKSDHKNWQVDTLSASESYHTADYFFVVDSSIQNKGVFFTDSNGWLVMRREMYKHQDYQSFFPKEGFDNINGNVYPITSFAYIEDEIDKVSINSDRPQGVISYREGSIWVNFDRLSTDDGKWVWEETFRSQYQKFTHFISVQNTDGQERKHQVRYDNGIYVQAKAVNEEFASKAETTNQEGNNHRYRESGLSSSTFKFSVKAWNDSTLLLRVQNMDDTNPAKATLYATNISVILTAFYNRQLVFDEIHETTIQGNQRYDQFIENKWSWHKIANLDKENTILNKVFAEKLVLRPLEIRAFKLSNPRFATDVDTHELQYTNFETKYALKDTLTDMQLDKNPVVEASVDYLLNQDHCDSINPPQASWSNSKQFEYSKKGTLTDLATPNIELRIHDHKMANYLLF